MTAAKTAQAGLEALPQKLAAWLIGRSPRWLRDSDAPRNDDDTYNGPALVGWFVEHETAKGTTDPLLVGKGDSPNLERYRKAKAELAEMDAAERRGQLQDIGAFCDWWARDVAPHIREAVAELDQHWPDAAKIMRAAIETTGELVLQRRTNVES